MTMPDSLPNFLIIGAMKCGTSTLAAQLAAQPGVFMTQPKEPNFFSDDAIYAKGLDWYRDLFAEAAPSDLKGEASTHYTKLPTYPETCDRMRAVLSEPRLVYIVRNPVDRAVSHYIHEWTEGRMHLNPIAAFENHPELVSYGCYAMQLEPFLEAFGREAVLLTSLERLKADPAAELARIGAHIGMSTCPEWKTEFAAQNVSAERIRKPPLYGLLVDNPVAQTLRRSLVPKALRTKIRTSLTFGERPELPPVLVDKLKAAFAEDQARLHALFPDVDLRIDSSPPAPSGEGRT